MKLPRVAQSEWEQQIMAMNRWIWVDVKYSASSGYRDSEGNVVDMTHSPLKTSLPTDSSEYCIMMLYGKTDFRDCLATLGPPSQIVCKPN